ncbi:uncharacterized protein LOC108600753 isoform X2 [Drosophila busckii]|uniref:uncharacterized protein LOC108600753 isoform X2 n=1 Tax=Drosophila busckii TaxID=30019 RepID=UPI00143311A3|nr:uncharacterized protein LOC108600753 isoform X2 [Drosophila busckii]
MNLTSRLHEIVKSTNDAYFVRAQRLKEVVPECNALLTHRSIGTADKFFRMAQPRLSLTPL